MVDIIQAQNKDCLRESLFDFGALIWRSPTQSVETSRLPPKKKSKRLGALTQFSCSVPLLCL